MKNNQLLFIAALVGAYILFVGQSRNPIMPEPTVDAGLIASTRSAVAVAAAVVANEDRPSLPDDLGNKDRGKRPPAVPPITPMPRQRPVMYCYFGNLQTCLPCRQAHNTIGSLTDAERSNLPFTLDTSRAIPSWVRATPTFHWQSNTGRWVSVSGWYGLDYLVKAWRASQAVQQQELIAGTQTLQPIGAARSIQNGRQLVDSLLGTVGQGEVRLTDNYSVIIPDGVSATLKRSGDKVEIVVNQPYPLFRLSWRGLRYDARVQGVTVEQNAIRVKLGGFPDVTLDVE